MTCTATTDFNTEVLPGPFSIFCMGPGNEATQHRDLAICMLHTGLAHRVAAGHVQVGEVSPPAVFVQFAVTTGEKVQSLVRLHGSVHEWSLSVLSPSSIEQVERCNSVLCNVLELTHDVRICKIRAGSDLQHDVRYKQIYVYVGNLQQTRLCGARSRLPQ